MQVFSPAATKRVALLERAGGPLLALSEYFEQNKYEVLRAADARSLTAAIKDIRRLSAVVVNAESLRGDGAEVVTSINELHPDMPILWFEPRAGTKWPRKVEMVGADLGKLRTKLATAVREELYSSPFLGHFTALCREVLSEYRLPATDSTPCVSACTSKLGDINAYIPFTGRRVSGHVMLCSSFSDLRQAYCQQFPSERSPGLDDLEDHLGEAVNRLVGRLKRVIDRDEDCMLGVSYFIRGEATSLRHKAGAPSLLIDFSGEAGRLHLELCFYHFDSWAMASLKGFEADDHAEAGVLKLL